MRLFIGDKNLSSWSLRPWLLMKHAGIPFEEHVMLFDRPDWRTAMGALSPSGRVPVLHDGALVIGDSLAIAEYLAERHPGLWPADSSVRAVARSISSEMHAGFPHLRRDLSMDVTARIPKRPFATETRVEVERILAIWATALVGGGPFLFGAFSIADAMFAPVVFRFRTYGVEITNAPAREWAERMLALPSMKEWEAGAAAEVVARVPDIPSPTSASHAYAVIFTSSLKPHQEYERMALEMEELAALQPGYLGFESARNPDGVGISVSYWSSLEAIRQWKDFAAHRDAQARGQNDFYERYEVRVCSVDRGYTFTARS